MNKGAKHKVPDAKKDPYEIEIERSRRIFLSDLRSGRPHAESLSAVIVFSIMLGLFFYLAPLRTDLSWLGATFCAWTCIYLFKPVASSAFYVETKVFPILRWIGLPVPSPSKWTFWLYMFPLGVFSFAAVFAPIFVGAYVLSEALAHFT